MDPSPVPTRKVPRDAEGWVTAANTSWVVALDNLSGTIPMWLSDSLCRAATGDGDVRRQLYTDGDVSVIAFRRAIIFNGIDVVASQGDLADRLLRVKLPRIRGGRRQEEEIQASWAQAHPHILGGLLDLAADVHRRLPSISVEKAPRMADYARVLAAVDEIMGTEGLDHYRQLFLKVASDTLDYSLLADSYCGADCARERRLSGLTLVVIRHLRTFG